MLDQAGEGPQGGGNIVADAFNEAGAHGKEESGGRGLRGGSGAVRETLVESRVPLKKVRARTEERSTRAIAALGEVAVLNQRGERKGINASLEGAGKLVEFGSTLFVGGGSRDKAQVVVGASVELAEGGDRATIAATPKGTVEAGKLGSVVRVRGGELVVRPHL